MLTDKLLVFEDWLASFQTYLFGEAIERDDAAIVITEYDSRPIMQCCFKYSFT